MDIYNTIQKIIILAPPILFAVTIHEVAHGLTALMFGDPTAKNSGRLTLNPIKHLDPFGTIVFFLTQAIGWARPVPVNPSYFRNPKRDMVWVSIAGPASNIAVAILSALFVRYGIRPISPFIPNFILTPIVYMALVSVQLNIGLAVFNLIPIPPLDGSKVLIGLLPKGLGMHIEAFEKWGFVLLLFMVFTGLTGQIIVPVIFYIHNLLMGL